MRVRPLAIVLAPLILAACGEKKQSGSDAEQPAESGAGTRVGETELPEGGLPPFSQRAGLQGEGGSWKQRLEPEPNELCKFTEHPPSERPEGWVVTAWSGNMDLYTDGYVLGRDPSARWVEAMWMKDRPVIAARDGMDDVWIEPQGDYSQTLLAIDDRRFTCERVPAPN